jgi:type 1 glutamine amidotransferase
MKRFICMKWFICLVALSTLLSVPEFARAQRDPSPKIVPAIPEKAAYAPKQPRKLLVFNTKRGHFDSALAAAKAMELMGKKTGAWSTTITDDPACFEADSLKGFDAVCINNTNGFDIFADALTSKATQEEKDAAAKNSKRREDALWAWLKTGKGVIGFHSATDSRSATLPELFTGKFNGHPWLGNEKVTVRVDDPKHPLTASLKGESFDIVDEIYQFTDKSHDKHRDKLRILLTLDMTKTPNKGRRDDQDYAVAWIKKVGDGRVFYSSLGHNPDVFWNPGVLKFYQDGIQFALGDVECDTRPSHEVGIKAQPIPAKK